MINQVILIGNLGDEVKLHHFDDNSCVGRFPLATSRSWTDKSSGEKKTKTSWHNITVNNKQAENCEKYLSKGSKVYVMGEINYRKWQGTDGIDHYATEIKAREIKFLDPPKSNGIEQPRTETTTRGTTSSSSTTNQPVPPADPDDDLPF